MTAPRSFFLRALLFALSSTTPLVVVGQTAGVLARPADASAPGEVVELSRFEVSTDKDTGYMAADTISSGRLSTNLLMTPSDTSVITRDLLNDLAVFSLEEATGWLTNSRPTELGALESNSVSNSTMDTRDYGSTGSLRGMSTQPATRNYFPSATTPMEYNVERVEGARGPNAILYGEGGPGGQINYLTKKAKNRNFHTLRLRGDTEGSMGLAVDINRTFGRDVAVRYNGSWFDGEGWQDRVKNNHVGNALSLVFHPLRGMTISFDADKTRTYRSGIISTYLDMASSWDRIPLAGKLTLTTAQASAKGLTILGSGLTKYVTYTDGLGFIDWKGYGQTAGLNLPLMPGYDREIPNTPDAPDKRFNANPEEVNITGKTTDASFAIEQRFAHDLIVELAAAHAEIEQNGANLRYSQAYIDPNTLLPDGRPNPNFGKLYSSTYYGRNIDGSTRGMKALRLAANRPFQLFGGVQNVSVIAQRQETSSHKKQAMKRIVDNPSAKTPITNNANMLMVVRYWDNLTTSLPDFSKYFEFRDVPEVDSETRRNTDSIQLGTSGSYFNNRLSIVGGFRRDKAELDTCDGDTSGRDPITGAMTKYTSANYETSNNSYSGGVVVFPIPSVGLYANYSDGFTVQTNSNPRIDGSFSEVGIVPSSVKTLGMRFRLFDGKLVASVGSYHAKETNSFMSVSVMYINDLWQNHPGNADKVIDTFEGTEVVTDTQCREGWGWEGEMTANVGNSLRFTANVAFPQTNQSNVGQDFRAYAAQHMATWEAWAADSSNPTRQAQDIIYLKNVKNSIANFQDGRTQNNTYKWRANVFGTYTFKATFLKGTRFGLGAQFHGPRVIGNQIDRPYDYIYSKTYQIFTSTLGRSFKFRGTSIDLQLNIMNLFNYGQPIIQGYSSVRSAPAPYAYKFLAPRTARLTATFAF